MRMAPSWPRRMVISEQDSPRVEADSAASRMFSACSVNRLTPNLSLRETEILAQNDACSDLLAREQIPHDAWDGAGGYDHLFYAPIER